MIVAALRKELSTDAKKSFAKAIYEAAKGVASMVTSGAAEVFTKITDTIFAFFAYIWSLYKKIIDYLALKKFFGDCEQKFSANSSLIYDTGEFVKWLSPWIGQLPIIASHCLASPVTGSYYGFLSTMVDGSSLAKGHSQFQSLKDPAKSYINGYSLKFSSSDPMVNTSLQIVQNGGVDMTNGAAAQSVGWFRRWLMKKGVTKRTIYSEL